LKQLAALAIAIWTKSEFDEPIKTLMIREGMKVQEELPAA
jgi:hypothetical protein